MAGWVHRWRDQGGLVFLDLRDRWGITQVTIAQESSPDVHALARDVRNEWVIQVSGTVEQRPDGMANPDLPTGEIEVRANNLVVLNRAKTPPFYINKEEKIDEALRMRYRYLDLRRPSMQYNLVLRHNVVRFIRNFLSDHGFVEIETPILFKTTPEGARDYLVPSRLHPGKFFALPQSPQQLKQLLMVAGYERYFQIARCFRDEDQRGDRQPEFTQLDLEMSFVTREDVMGLIEEMMTCIVEQVSDRELVTKPFPRLTHHEALLRYGTDKPDLRYGLEIEDVSDLVAGSSFRVFTETVAAGNPVRAICVPGVGDYSRKQIGELEEIAKAAGAKGLATMAIEAGGEVRSSFAKFFTPEQLQALVARMKAGPGDLILFAADSAPVVAAVLDALRREMAGRLGLADPNQIAFCWIIDFPLFEWNEDEQRWDPSHHLFTAPMWEDVPLLDTEPGKARGQQYDLACNGYEDAGGSIRIHDRAIQEKIFGLIGLDVEDAKDGSATCWKPSSLARRRTAGSRPASTGCDAARHEPNIREVIAFPKTQQAADLMAGAPSEADAHQL